METIVEIGGNASQLSKGIVYLDIPLREGNKIREGTTDIIVQNSGEAIENWEVEDAEPLCTRTQLMIQDKEKADFQGHVEEPLELLL